MQHQTRLPLVLLYGSTIFLSAFLLFQVQPIMGKLILPWFGGSAAVWTSCMLFFQLLLLGGYMYCHWLVSKLRPRTQALVHISLLVLAVLSLPILPDAGWKPLGNEDPVLRILGLLGAAVGLPYFVLSTTGPLLQAWFARERDGAVPYRLFALSNLGSMLALLGYPVVIEPWLPARIQAGIWAWGFTAFALLCAGLALHGARSGAPQAAKPHHETTPAGNAPGLSMLALWAALAACPSILLVAITSHLTQNVAPVPLLWVLPLALYLASFILCFEHPRWYKRGIYALLSIAGFVALAILPDIKLETLDLRIRVGAYLLALFAFCMSCHGELVRRSPPATHLTSFYLMISLGGAIGGLFVGFVAPHYFVSDFELPVGLVVCAALLGFVWLHGVKAVDLMRVAIQAKLLRLAALVGVAALAGVFINDQFIRIRNSVDVGRNFYGSLRISDEGKGPGSMRTLSHGRIIHGRQFLEAHRRNFPTTYYGEASGVGLAIKLTRKAEQPQRVGVIGLGIGTLLAYSRPQDVYRCYEINALVLDLARRHFHFLGDSKAEKAMLLGDARLTLERESPQSYDVLVVDAFSGDSVPGHLLTREAFELYKRHLAPGGVLAVHVSNKFLNLPPVVQLSAEATGMEAKLVINSNEMNVSVFGSDWVLVTNNRKILEAEPVKAIQRPITRMPRLVTWSDDYNSLMPIIK